MWLEQYRWQGGQQPTLCTLYSPVFPAHNVIDQVFCGALWPYFTVYARHLDIPVSADSGDAQFVFHTVVIFFVLISCMHPIAQPCELIALCFDLIL
jgi:hypothetical protein